MGPRRQVSQPVVDRFNDQAPEEAKALALSFHPLWTTFPRKSCISLIPDSPVIFLPFSFCSFPRERAGANAFIQSLYLNIYKYYEHVNTKGQSKLTGGETHVADVIAMTSRNDKLRDELWESRGRTVVLVVSRYPLLSFGYVTIFANASWCY